MDPVILEFLGVVVRWALTSAGTSLVAHHVMTGAQSETYVTAFTHDALLALPVLGGLAWGLYAKYCARIKFLTALGMPVGSTENQVIHQVASGAPTPSVLTPTNTAPGVPQ